MNKAKIKEIKWLFQFLKPYRIQWFLGYLFDVVGTGVFQICNGIALERLGGGLLNKDKISVASGLAIILAGAAVITITGILFWLCYGISIASLRQGLKNHIFCKILTKEYNMAEDSSEKIMTSLNQDVELAVGILGEELRPLIYGAGTSIIAITAILYTNVLIGLICLATFAGNLFVTIHYKDRLERNADHHQNMVGNLVGSYKTLFDGAAILRSGDTGGKPLGWIKEAAERVRAVKKKENHLILKQNLFIHLFLNLNHVLPMTLGVYLCTTGALEIGKVFFLVQMSIQFVFDYQLMGPSLVSIAKAFASVERLYILDGEEEESVQYGKKTMEVGTDYSLEFKDMKVNYHGKEILSIDDLQIPKNKMIAVIGESGSGKSTFLKAIMQVAPWSGQLKIFGADARQYDLKELRKAFSYIEQNPHLFHVSIWDNILFGNKNASREEVLLAARQAGVDEFANRFAEGYDTKIGEDGVQLSGGECQRIAIARALLRNAPIFVMDEITSALDNRSEYLISETIEKLREDHTIIIAAHRMNTIESADYILQIKDGKPSPLTPQRSACTAGIR